MWKRLTSELVLNQVRPAGCFYDRQNPGKIHNPASRSWLGSGFRVVRSAESSGSEVRVEMEGGMRGTSQPSSQQMYRSVTFAPTPGACVQDSHVSRSFPNAPLLRPLPIKVAFIPSPSSTLARRSLCWRKLVSQPLKCVVVPRRARI